MRSNSGETLLHRALRRMFRPMRRAPRAPASVFRMLERPFSFSDLERVPEDWRVEGPDFVGVGAARSGTSWWYSLLLQHPAISPNRLGTKELHYLNHFSYRAMCQEEATTYRAAFAAPRACVSGEWSPGYLCHPLCIERLAAIAPDARILLILRNPIDRALSHLNHARVVHTDFFGFVAEERQVFDVLSSHVGAIFHSLYAAPLARLFRHFDSARILVLQYEKCRRSPGEEIARTYRFLGIDDGFRPSDLARPVNRVESVLPALRSEDRRDLAELFREDVRATGEACPEIELGLWPDFAQ